MEKQQWMIIENEGWKIIVPDTDILPHSTEVVSKKMELAGSDCPCKPKIDWQNNLIIHNSFLAKEAIEKSLAELKSGIPEV